LHFDRARVWPGAPASTVVTLIVLGVWYALGVRRLWRQAGVGHGIARRAALGFAAGWLVLAVSLAPAVDPITDALFSAHMGQHLALILIAAPLLAVSQPIVAGLWALPLGWRRAIGRWWARTGWARRATTVLLAPMTAWVLHALALVIWHIPPVYAWGEDHALAHALEHASYLGTACLFWYAALQPTGRRRLGPGQAVFYVTTMGAVMSAFAAVLTFGRTAWYAAAPAAWGLTPLQDQQLAGVIMWVPAGIIYLGAALLCAVQWIDPAVAQP
jgi:putative membrane protein